MRERELNILNMTPESYIRKRCAERERKQKESVVGGVTGVEKIEQVEDFVSFWAFLVKLRWEES